MKLDRMSTRELLFYAKMAGGAYVFAMLFLSQSTINETRDAWRLFYAEYNKRISK